MKRKLFNLCMTALLSVVCTSALALSKVGDVYQIGSAADLKAFADLVNNGTEPGADAVLTANIDYTAYTTGFIGRNETGKHYTGTFDGQGHTVTTNIVNDAQWTGLFGSVNNATIKNLIVDGSVQSSVPGIGGLGGLSWGATKIENVVVKSTVTISPYFSGNCTCGGIFGDMEDTGSLKNCAFYGSIYVGNSGNTVGGLVGWVGNSGVNFTNCFVNIADVVSQYRPRFSGAGSPTIVNSYVSSDTDGNGFTAGQIASGEVCYKLNGNTQGGTNWYQTIGTDTYPVPFSTHSKVYLFGSSYISDVAYIGNATDLNNFVAVVNAGGTALNGVLTNNIDYHSYTGVSDMIGTASNKYQGTFDGQGHKITVAFTNRSEMRTGLFRRINGATIQNLKVDGTITTNQKFAGGIVAHIDSGESGTIRNCESAVTINGELDGDASYAGILGAFGGSTARIENCLFSGSIIGTKCKSCCGIAGFAANNNITITKCLVTGTMNVNTYADVYQPHIIARGTATFSNNYYVGTYSGFRTSSATSATEAQKTSGALCYLLNGSEDDGTNWTQTIGTNTCPIPFSTSQTVHQASTGCYTNLPVSDGTVQIANGTNLKKFASEVSAGNYAMNAVLTGNIDYTSYTGLTDMIGNDGDIRYQGTFDGQGHTVTVAFVNNTSQETGLFRRINGATIQNLKVDGTITTNQRFAGGVVARVEGSNGGTIRNCEGAVIITDEDGTGDASHGGVLACANGTGFTVENCLFSGRIDASNREGCSGVVGWTNNSGTRNVTKCLVTGTMNVKSDKNHNIIIRGTTTTCSNNYYVGTYSGIGLSTATSATEAQKTSGELCYLLNGSVNAGTNWYQDLSGTEAYPHPFGTKTVSAGQWFSAANDVYYNLEDGNYTVYQLNMDEGKTTYAVPANVTARNISITRDIPAGQWIGLCLPFDYDIPSGWDVRELAYVNGTGDGASMIFRSATSIVAGKPYLVKPEDAVTTIEATNTTIATAASTISMSGVNMIGNLRKTAITEGSYYINTSSLLKKLTATSADLKGFRAYFTVDAVGGGSLVKALSYGFEEDDATSINEELRMKNEESEAAIYNLAGQRIQKMQKGVNLVNGKKVLF